MGEYRGACHGFRRVPSVGAKTFTLSDGSRREIELTPMVHDGKQVVQRKDSGGLTWMSLDGATTNGTLMIRVSDDTAAHDALRRQGWK